MFYQFASQKPKKHKRISLVRQRDYEVLKHCFSVPQSYMPVEKFMRWLNNEINGLISPKIYDEITKDDDLFDDFQILI